MIVPTDPFWAQFSRLQTLRGAIASVALSHEEGHDCDVCRAAHGDEAAFVRMVAVMDNIREPLKESDEQEP